jgi:hypothetical protein
VWDTGTGRQVVELAAPVGARGAFTSVAFSNDGKGIATGNADGRVRFWDVGSGALVDTLDGPRLSGASPLRSNLVAFDPDGATFVSAQGDGDWKIRLWRLSNGKVLRDFELSRCAEDCTVRSIRFHDGLIVASVSTDDIFVLDPGTGDTVSRLKGRLILLARNGEDPAALIAAGNTIRIYDMRTGALVQEVESPELASARVDDSLRLGGRRGPDGSWLIFPAQAGAAASR